MLDEQIRDNSCVQTKPEDFRFILFSGEAGLSEFQKIREAIVEVVPKFFDRFPKDPINTFWVGAVGAGRQAKDFSIKQPVTQLVDLYKCSEPGEHQDHSHSQSHNEL